MVKQPACAAAISSSGLVPFSFSNLVLKEYGVSASTPESVERFPLPARPVPRQTAFALRIILHFLAVACLYPRYICEFQKVVWWVEVAARAMLAPQVCW